MSSQQRNICIEIKAKAHMADLKVKREDPNKQPNKN